MTKISYIKIILFSLFLFCTFGCKNKINNIEKIEINEYPIILNNFQEDLKIQNGSIAIIKQKQGKIIPININMIQGYQKNKTEDQILKISYHNHSIEWIIPFEKLLPINAKIIKSNEDFNIQIQNICDNDLLVFYPRTYEINPWVIKNKVQIMGIDEDTTIIEINNDNKLQNFGISIESSDVSFYNLTIKLIGDKNNYILQMANNNCKLSNINLNNITCIGGSGINIKNISNTTLNQVNIKNTNNSTLVLCNSNIIVSHCTLGNSLYGSIYLANSIQDNLIQIDKNTKMYGYLCIEECKGNEKSLEKFKKEWKEINNDQETMILFTSINNE